MLQVFERLNKVNSMLLKSLYPIVKAENLNPTELMILWKVYKKGTFRATDLARDADVPPSTFTGIFDRLAAKDYLIRESDTEDRRSVLVRGTDELNRLMERITKAAGVKLSDIFKDMPPDMPGRISADLELMQQYLEKHLRHKTEQHI